MDIQLGETVIIDGETRTVSALNKNTEGGTIVKWYSRTAEGGCMPSLWASWREGKNGSSRGRDGK